MLNEHGDEKEYYDYLISINCINKENFSDILKDMGNRHTEIKSYLIIIFIISGIPRGMNCFD